MAIGHRYRLLLDESMEFEVLRRLVDAGQDAEHVARLAELGKGVADPAIPRRSLEDDRFILTYDEDFLTEFDEDEYRAILFVEDATMRPDEVARAVVSMARYYPPEAIRGVVTVGREWLID